MSNKQEFPISNKNNTNINTSFNSNNSKKDKIYSNHPYLEHKPFLHNDYTRDNGLTIQGPLTQKNNITTPKPNYAKIENIDYYTKINNTFQNESEANIPDSFKFSEFQQENHGNDALNLKTLDVYNSYDLEKNQSKFKKNSISTVFHNKLEEALKFIANVFKTQISFLRTLDQAKQNNYFHFSGDMDKICQISFREESLNSIDFNEFLKIFRKLSIEADLDDIKLLLWRYAVEKIGLERNAFKRYFSPIFKNIDYNKNNRNYDEKELIAKVLKMNLNFEYSLEMLRKEIKEKNIGLREVFDQIGLNEEILTPIRIKSFLIVRKININDEDLNALYFLYDPNHTGLNFAKFYQELLPKL